MGMGVRLSQFQRAAFKPWYGTFLPAHQRVGSDHGQRQELASRHGVANWGRGTDLYPSWGKGSFQACATWFIVRHTCHTGHKHNPQHHIYLRIINLVADRLYPASETKECKSHGDDVSAIVDSWFRGVLMYYVKLPLIRWVYRPT